MNRFNKKWHSFLNSKSLKLKAGALYLAIFVSFVLTLLTGFFILNAYYNRYFLDSFDQRQKLQDNVNSGLTLLLSDFSTFHQNGSITVDLFDEGTDLVTLSTASWGAYSIASCSAKNEKTSLSRTALIGATMDVSDRIGLYLTDLGRYLSVSGSTYLSGLTFLPALGVRKASIEGVSFLYEKMVNGIINISNSNLPSLPEDIFKSNFPYMLGHIPKEDSVLVYKHIAKKDTIYNSFTNRTLVLYSESDISINNILIKGNIRLLSPGSIVVAEKAKLDGIILQARNIYLAPRLKGNFQAFARDTLLIGSNCEMEYPSVAAIMDTSTKENYLHIMPGAKVNGLIFLEIPTMISGKSFLNIDSGAETKGQIVWPGPLQMKGRHRGSLFCNTFILKTESVYYENHLLGARIDGDALPDSYLGLPLRNKNPYYSTIRWLQ